MRASIAGRRCAVWLLPFCVLFAAAGCNTIAGWSNNMLGAHYYDEGNYGAALDEFRRAVMDDPGNPDYLHNLATAMKKQGDLAGAERVYRHALQIAPDHQPTHHSLALLLMETGRSAEAVALLDEWRGAEPYRPEPYIELGWIYREQGDIAAAEAVLKQALKVAPDHPTVLAHLGQIYQDQGRGDLALAMYQKSLQLNWFQPSVQSRVASLGHSPIALAMQPAPPANGTMLATAPALPLTGPPHTAAMPVFGVASGWPPPMPVASPLPARITGPGFALGRPVLAAVPATTTVVADAPAPAGATSTSTTMPDNPDPAHVPARTADNLPVARPH